MTTFGHVFAPCTPSFASTALAEPPERTREYWYGLVASDFEVPAGEKRFDLPVEMNALLGSPDPVLRDEVAFAAAGRCVPAVVLRAEPVGAGRARQRGTASRASAQAKTNASRRCPRGGSGSPRASADARQRIIRTLATLQ